MRICVQGPTCIIVRSLDDQSILGAYTEHRWKDSNRFYGNSNTFLFTLFPHLNIYRCKDNGNEAFQWLNLKVQ